MINRLTLFFGSGPAEPPIDFVPGAVTILVGPNNSGKSLTLREVGSALFDFSQPPHQIPWPGYIPLDHRRIVRSVESPAPSWESLRQQIPTTDSAGTAYVGSLLAHQAGTPPSINLQNLVEEMEKSPTRSDLLAHLTLLVRRTQVEILDGQRRLMLVDPRPIGNLRSTATNHLQALFRDDGRRRILSNATKEAFGLYLVLDPTDGGQLKVAMSRELPGTPDEERSLSPAAIEFFSHAIPISDMSDGVKAFSGILAAVLSTNLRVILIDEPDAFLHPPLAQRLGRALTGLASERDANVLAATHDPHFLLGCVQAGKPMNIVRLTYRNEVPTARLLSSSRIQQLMRDPLLRSTRVLDALFHEGAIICEADADRAFYEEINERLCAAGRGGAFDCVFLNAQNKQTIRRIVGPLRGMGIPAAAIVDLDLLRKGENDLRELLVACNVPPSLAKGFGQTRGEIEAAFNALGVSPKRVGLAGLDQSNREAAEALLDDLGAYGIFLVPVGELERWLAELGMPQGPDQKQDWLPAVFEKMGSDPEHPEYLHPAQGDVWSFIERVGRWLGDPARRGMPA